MAIEEIRVFKARNGRWGRQISTMMLQNLYWLLMFTRNTYAQPFEHFMRYLSPKPEDQPERITDSTPLCGLVYGKVLAFCLET